MPPHPGPLLVDTNVILECHRTASWRALTHRYPTETVEECVKETQTGFQHREPEQRIDETELRESLAAVRPVSNHDLAVALVREPLIGHLDAGERHLWAHALTRADAWILCGPDKASMRVGVSLGFKARIVSLERLLLDVGHRPRTALARQYSQRWLDEWFSTTLFR
jgi:hypothetical protein